jgi:hypothetical protein
MPRVRLLLVVLVLCGSIPASAWATQTVKLKAAFSPDRLGVGTTIHLRVAISTTTGAVPSPVTELDVALPAGMGLGTTDLGEATCNALFLERQEPEECSANSQIGAGTATVELPVGLEPVVVHTHLTLYMGKPVAEHTTMLFYSQSHTPVVDERTFQGQLLPGAGAFGAHLNTVIPLIETWPGGNDASIVSLQTTLGPEGITYYRYSHGRRIAYSPEGITVPERCPRGGFPFRATYRFQDGTTSAANASVACPPNHHAHRRG